MAHFAQLNENNIVTKVIVVGNEDTSDADGLEVEEIGISFCKNRYGEDTIWKQTSYNHRLRFRYAGIGYMYDEELDAFIPPKPFPSWVLVNKTWQAPTPMPNDGRKYDWVENMVNWVLIPEPAIVEDPNGAQTGNQIP